MLCHKRNVHHQDKQLSNNSDTDQSLSKDFDARESDNEEETVDKYDPWDSLIQKTFQRCQVQFMERVDNLTNNCHIEQEETRGKAYKELKLLFRKALVVSLSDRVMWFNAMQVDPKCIYKTIRNTAKTLIAMEDYGRDEAWKYAISKRKYLLTTVLEAFDSPEMEEAEQSETDD